MKKILVIMLFCISGIAFCQKPIFTSAKINSATIYSNSAELNHVASATVSVFSLLLKTETENCTLLRRWIRN
jgi:hypothetical protein